MAVEHTTGIYEIRNLVNGKRYIGSAVNFGNRWGKHLSELRRGVHHSRHLQASWSKHGLAAFEFRPIIICSKSNLLLYEQIALDYYKPEFNIRIKAESALGVKRTPEFIEKVKAGRAASGGWSPSKATREKISATLKGRRGRKAAPEAIERMRAAQRARGSDHLRPLWDAKIGVPRTAEVKQKLSRASAKLSECQVRLIRDRAADGELQKSLGMEFGVRQSCISEIVRRVTYTWVD